METLSVLDYHNSRLVRKTIDEGCSGINIKGSWFFRSLTSIGVFIDKSVSEMSTFS